MNDLLPPSAQPDTALRTSRPHASAPFVIAFALTVIAPLAYAAPTAPPRPLPRISDEVGEAPSSGFHLELLPVAFQKNPVLNMTAVTEFTDHGRTLPTASPEHPVYYIIHDGGFKPMGQPTAGEKTPAPEQLAQALRDTLATSGFLPASEGHPPGLALFYFWGSHSAYDQEFAMMFPEANWRALLERAALVGGVEYRNKLQASAAMDGDGLLSSLSFLGRERTQSFLYDQASQDIYYIVVSAYPYQDLAHNHRLLAWRTTMTVSGVGTSMSETLRPLVMTGGPYFGHETQPVALRRRLKRGTVELGPLNVIDENVVLTSGRAPAQPPPPKPAAPH